MQEVSYRVAHVLDEELAVAGAVPQGVVGVVAVEGVGWWELDRGGGNRGVSCSGGGSCGGGGRGGGGDRDSGGSCRGGGSFLSMSANKDGAKE